MSSQFEPSDTGYKEKVIESFNRQEVMKTVNASILAIRPGEIELEFPYQSNLTQQHGFIHAGIVSTVLDSACGYAAFSLMPENAAVLSIEFKINFSALFSQDDAANTEVDSLSNLTAGTIDRRQKNL